MTSVEPAAAPARPRQSQKAGLSPGTLVHIGERHVDTARIAVMEYDDEVLSVRELPGIDDAPARCRAYKDRPTVVWINVDGIHDAALFEALGAKFDLHALVLEDVMNSSQRPKLEEYDDCHFCVLKMLDVDDDTDKIMIEQVSMVIGRDFVLTFQERAQDVFDGVRDRIKSHKGKIRKMGADYLAYALVDAIVDHYFTAVEHLNDKVESLETRIQSEREKVDFSEFYTLKRELAFLRRSLFPAREVIGQLARHEEDEIISPAVDVYFRDVHDHVIQVTDALDTSREMVISLLEMHHSLQANRLNEVMRVLTVISTFFMPVTFIAGIYGMNFDNMPELHHPLGYFICLGVMAVVGVAMAVYIRRNRWL
jgi:magnesium transporter